MNKQDVNKVQLAGRVAAEPDVRFLPDGSTMVASFSMYTNESWKDASGTWQKRSERHNIVAFGPRAKYASKLEKGQRVEIEGKLQTRSWTDANDVKHYRTEVNASLVRPLQDELKMVNGQADEAEEVEAMNVEELPF